MVELHIGNIDVAQFGIHCKRKFVSCGAFDPPVCGVQQEDTSAWWQDSLDVVGGECLHLWRSTTSSTNPWVSPALPTESSEIFCSWQLADLCLKPVV